MRIQIPKLSAAYKRPPQFVALTLMMCLLCLRTMGSTIYYDSFETYPQQNPAPNPLTNGPAGGQWFYVDPNPPTTANEHRITESFVAGGALNSRCWYTLTNNAMLTNAISLAGLDSGTNVRTFHLSFTMASDTTTAGRTTTFTYGIGSSSGTLTFLSGSNWDNSQVFSNLNDTGFASSGSIGKTPDRQFEVTFQGAGLSSADKIYLQFSRITNNAGAVVALLMDDVRLMVDDNSQPLLTAVTPVLSLEHVRFSFSEPVDPSTATNAANYSFGGSPLMALNATLIDPTTVEIYTGGQTPGATYTANVSGVLAQTGISMVATQLNFTALTLGISPVRYDAGNTTNQPSGPADPGTSDGGFWTPIVNTNPGMSAGPVSGDNGTSYNAWNVTDQNVLASGGSLNYTLPIDQPSDNLARSNGWRIILRSRLVDNFGGTAADQLCSYSDNTLSLRFGLFFGVNTSGYLFATVLGGNTYNLTSDINSYHTHILVYDAPSASASYYFDGQLIVSNYPGQSVGGVNGLTFGSANSTGSGAMNYNLVQMDVVGATQPAVTLQPLSTTNGVGQKVTFTAGFRPFVNAYQWLSNEVVIAGATANTYTTGFIATNYNGASYTCRALSAFGNVETAPAVLTVTTDVTPPFVAAIKASLIPGHVIVTYSEPVQPSYATNLANYVWAGGGGIVTVSAIMLDPFTVELVAAPLSSGNYYTLQINNIRDTSNLIIATNSLATFFDPQLLSLYRYNAGDATNEPSGPPDPTQVDGGNWNLRLDADTNLSVGPVTNDLGTGLNGWQVRDASTVFGDYVYYTEPVAAELFPQIFNSGWLLTIRCRLSEVFPGASLALFAQFADASNNRYGLSFNLDNSANLIVGNSMGSAFVSQTVLNDGSGLNDYHTHQIYYNPMTTNASYYFDGNLMLSGWAFSNAGASTPEGLLWGALSSAGKGTMNVNLIELSAAPFPFATVATTNGLQIAYRGILQSTTNLASPAVWTSLATNTTTGTNIYSVPGGSTQQFFRSRMP